jgi:hypothetical protein
MAPTLPLPAVPVDPSLRIAVLRGRLVAWLAQRALPVELEDADIARIEASLQIAIAAVDPAELPDTQPLPPDAAWDRPIPRRVRAAPGLALSPARGGWACWSARSGANHHLSPAVARTLLDRARGRESPVAPLGLASLLAAGLLFDADEAAAAAAMSSSPMETAPPVHLRAGDPWDGCAPDGRVPIYFVTHHLDHLPLALGMLRAAIMAHEGGALLARYQPLPIVAMSVRELQALYARFGPGVWLFSDYVWSVEYNLRLSALVKQIDRRNLTVHGGPSAPKYEQACERFMQEHPHVDVVVRGAGEDALVEALAVLARGGIDGLAGVAGLTVRLDARIVRGAERPRLADLSSLPSPYATGMFDHYGGAVIAAVLETNRGCPYSCTFCDWGSATQEKIHRFDLDRVKGEIEWIGRHRIRVLWIADANFGIFERDVEIAEFIARTRAQHGFPGEVVVNYPKNATERIARIVSIFVGAGICSQGIISIQTTDEATLRVIRRDNIKTKRYDELGATFRREGLPLATDLMIGLPGATPASFAADLQRYFDDDVAVKAYRTELLTNSPMADPDYMREHAIRVDASNLLIATASYSEADLARMLSLWSAFDLADGYGVMRYILRFVQWDHGVPATTFLTRLVDEVGRTPARWPALAWLLRHFARERCALGGWGPVYDELGRFVRELLVVDDEKALAVALQVSRLLMPEAGRELPRRYALELDFVGYFQHNVRSSPDARKRLRDMPTGTLEVSDPMGIGELDLGAFEQYDNHQVFYDLPAVIARHRSRPNFVPRTGAVAV